MNHIDIISKVENKLEEYNQLKKRKSYVTNQREEIQEKAKDLLEELDLTELSRKQLNSIINDSNKEYLDSIKKSVDKALAYVFDDNIYEFEMVTDNKRIEFYINDVTKGLVKTMDKIGGGIRVVVCVCLQMFFISSRGYKPVLFSDESLYDVSEEYREKFFNFVSRYCKKNNFSVVVISHDPSIAKYIENVIDLKTAMSLDSIKPKSEIELELEKLMKIS